jgi:NAD(P)-dependent dehydrogenase (short-subunit alcohol dehydrogenase family)
MLTGRTIVITGAARGLGHALAEAAAKAGARLVLGDIDAVGGAQTASAIAATGASVRFLPVDLGDPASIEAFATDIAAREGALDGLVNNGAIATGIGGPTFDAIEIDTFDRVMRVNVRGTWLMTRALAPLLARGADARIVNIASDTALWGAPRLLAYVASKGAVMAMTRSLSRELGPQRIGVSCVAPGILRTQSTEYVPAERHAHYETGRAVPGPQNAEDVAGTVLFLLTPAALAVTGQVVPVNAGFVFT